MTTERRDSPDVAESPPSGSTRRHLESLYEISVLLTNFVSVPDTLARVVSIIAEAVAMRTAVIVEERDATPRALVWHVADAEPAQVVDALAQARRQFAYLAGYDGPRRERLDSCETRATVLPPPRTRPSRRARSLDSRRIVVPLAVDQRRVFGALLVEADAALDEVDIAFLNTAVIQLAIALDRHDHLQNEKRLRERAEVLERAEKALLAKERLAHGEAELAARRLEFLVEASGRITASLDRPTTLAGLARLALPLLADWALVDAVVVGGAVHRIAVTDPARAKLGAGLEGVRPRSTFAHGIPDRVLATGRPEIVNAVSVELLAALASSDERVGLVRALGVSSALMVPVLLGTETLGAITFVRGEPGRTYDEHDLMLALELCRRGALALENARLYESARASIRTRDDFLAIVSHDLRSPLSAIVLNANLLALTAKQGEGGEVTRVRAENVRRVAERMDRLIADLLDVTAIESGRFALDERAIDAVALVEEAVEMMRPLAARRSLTIVCNGASVPLHVFGDRGRLLQIFSNLVGNAIKFTEETGSIEVGVSRLEGDAVFMVSDDGPGIPPEHLKRVFDRYWQATRSRTGVGLGLSITKMIVEAHGGGIWAESVVGAGTAVKFRLPLSTA